MDINVAQVLVSASVSLLVGAVSAWVAGVLGVRHGLERAKQEKAFDHRLEWHVRTIRAMTKLQLGMEEYLSTAKKNREAAIPIAKKVDPLVDEFLLCTYEAALFTNRGSVILLKEGAKKFCDVTHATATAVMTGESTNSVLQSMADLNVLVRSIEVELTRSHREQLGLDKIQAEDL